MKFTQLAKSLEEGIAPVYLVEGEESYFRDHAVESIRAACNISQPLLNDMRFEGETLKGDKLSAFRDGLYSFPLFDEKRLVRVYEFYPSEREWEQLQKYIDAPCPSTVLVIVNGGKKGTDLKKKKGLAYVDCSRADRDTLSRWLFHLMKKSGLVPDGDAMELMVKFCAQDAARMKKETEKLRLLLGEGGRVTCAAVEEYIAKDAEYKIFELTQAASKGNYTLFSEILSDLMQKGFDENAVLSSLTSHFKTLLEVSRVRGTEEAVGKKLGMHPYSVRANREVARRLGEKRTEELYRALYSFTAQMRGGMYLKTGAMQAAIAKIFFSEAK